MRSILRPTAVSYIPGTFAVTKTRGAGKVDSILETWQNAHLEQPDLYRVTDADSALFRRHLRGPVVQAIESIAKLQQRRLRILEVGCGSGLASICLALQGHDVTAVDVSDHLLSEAGRLASAAGQLFPLRPLQIQFAHGNVFDLRQYAGQYDLVLSFGLLVIWRDQARRLAALSSLRGPLTSKGWILVGTTYTLHPLFRTVALKPMVADLADHNLTILTDEVKRTGFEAVGHGAAGVSDHFHQWLANPFDYYPLKVANYVFTHLPRRWQLAVAPHVFVIGRLGYEPE